MAFKFKNPQCCVVVVAAVFAALPQLALGQIYFKDTFDTDSTADWKVNDNGAGTNAANFFFDYSTVGIPPAPNTVGGTTRGLKLGANLDPATAPTSGNIPGLSVSPIGGSFVENYEVRLDWWSNYIGPLEVGATGSTMLSSFGVLTSGTTANFPGAVDGVFFSATGDGQSSADFRAYSVERPTSYDIFPASGNPLDAHAVYAAGSRNQSAALYTSTFPAGATAPGSQASQPTQTGSTLAGAAGFRWHDVRVGKVGNVIGWTVNGVVLASVDTTLFVPPVGGTNILLGHSDTNFSTNSSATLLQQFQFTLIDNVRVTDYGFVEPDGDFNNDGHIDARDYVVWRNNNGSAADYDAWRANYANGVNDCGSCSPVGSGTSTDSASVPEPSTLFLLAIGAVSLLGRRRAKSQG